MSPEEKYDPENIFAKIIRGDLPCVKVYEDDAVLSFMDLFPQAEGHCLVIHKSAAAVDLFDLSAEALQELIVGVKKVAAAVKDTLSPDGVRIIQFNGAPAGQTVFHTHFHVIPVREGVTERPHAGGGPAPTEDLEAIAAKIRTAF